MWHGPKIEKGRKGDTSERLGPAYRILYMMISQVRPEFEVASCDLTPHHGCNVKYSIASIDLMTLVHNDVIQKGTEKGIFDCRRISSTDTAQRANLLV